MYTVKIASTDDFRESREIWNKLASEMPLPSIFCTWEWIYTWWEHFGKKYEPKILFVYKDADLKAILPLTVHGAILHKGWLAGRILTYCGSMELYPDHLDIICPQHEAEPCIKAVFEFLTNKYQEWDVLNLNLVTEGNNLTSSIIKNQHKFNVEIQKASVSPYIPLSNSFDEYMKSFGAKQKHNMMRLLNRLYTKHGVELVCHDGVLDTSRVLGELISLHRLRKQNKGVISSFDDSSIFDYHVALARRLSDNGWLRLLYLKKDEKIIAAAYGFVYGKRFHYYQSGFDPVWEKESIGSSLIIELIKKAYNEGLMEFDFLRGNEEYKKRWAPGNRVLLSVNIYNETINGTIAKVARRFKRVLKKVIG